VFNGIHFRVGLLLGASAVPFAASAQTASDAQPLVSAPADTAEQHNTAPGLDEVVVTAERRESKLQETPLAVTAISGTDLQKRGIANVQDLTLSVPGLSFGESLGEAHIAIRGIGGDNVGPGVDSRVAFYQDGVYIGRPTAQLGGMFDVERVEVLKGPQGTLYGRNATGGAINVLSRTPTDQATGYLRLSYGNYNALDLEGALSGPLTDTLSARVAVQDRRHDGYGTNLVNGAPVDDKSERSVRVSLRWKPTERLELLTSADYHRQHDNDFGQHFLGQANPAVGIRGLALGGSAALNSRDIQSDQTPFTRSEIWGVTETATYHFDWAQLKSITAYRNSNSHFLTDIDGTSVPLGYAETKEPAHQFTETLQLTGDIAQFHWLTGIDYFGETDDPQEIIPLNSAVTGGPLSLRQGFYQTGHLRTTAAAPYVRATYDLTSRLSLTVGGRYNYEKKRINDLFELDFSRAYSPLNPAIPVPPFPRSAAKSFSQFTPSAALSYKFSDRIFGYATYTEGFKSGGFNFGVAQPPFLPEKIKDYEAGLKTTLFDGHLRANIAGFYYDYSQLQVQIVRGTNSPIENAAAANIYGTELEITAQPVPNLKLDGSLSLLHSEYRDYHSANPDNAAAGVRDLSGHQLTQAPKYSSYLAAEYRWPIHEASLNLRGEYNYTARVYFTPFNERAVSQSGYGTANAFATYLASSGAWSVGLFARNLTDKQTVAQAYVSSQLFGFPVLGTFIPPRTYGVTLDLSF
jgi:iron complex outermembrane recepter protein